MRTVSVLGSVLLRRERNKSVKGSRHCLNDVTLDNSNTAGARWETDAQFASNRDKAKRFVIADSYRLMAVRFSVVLFCFSLHQSRAGNQVK